MHLLPEQRSDSSSLSGLHNDQNEYILDNRRTDHSDLVVAVSIGETLHKGLLDSLLMQRDAQYCEIILYDDLACDQATLNACNDFINHYPGRARLIRTFEKRGVWRFRERITKLTSETWILLMDGLTRPDDREFLARYRAMALRRKRPAIYAGGFSLRFAQRSEETELYAALTEASDALPANDRLNTLGHRAFTSNILVHRYILQNFDMSSHSESRFWGHADWALDVAHHHRVEHVDNPVTDFRLRTDHELLALVKASAPSFARMVRNHPRTVSAMRIYRAAKLLAKIPFRSWLTRKAERKIGQAELPVQKRLWWLRIYRAANYAEHL